SYLFWETRVNGSYILYSPGCLTSTAVTQSLVAESLVPRMNCQRTLIHVRTTFLRAASRVLWRAEKGACGLHDTTRKNVFNFAHEESACKEETASPTRASACL
ncbi:unnamed protein product, partial [Scytosiphon promiscuus]